ncbi:MAG TPA: hypothetical protein VK816_00775 [Jatrophihabitantaceae bacterium]|nr:hypothetical protein [Jatrophihabitantaceae bacterium]
MGFLVVGGVVSAASSVVAARNRGLPLVAWPFTLYNTWDGGHFLRIARYGYYPPPGHQLQLVSAAFLPGYPLPVVSSVTCWALATPRSPTPTPGSRFWRGSAHSLPRCCCGGSPPICGEAPRVHAEPTRGRYVPQLW